MIAAAGIGAILEFVAAAAIAIYVVVDWPPIVRADDDEAPFAGWPASVNGWELDALVHASPDGEMLELPLADGWDEDSILRTLEHIEAL